MKKRIKREAEVFPAVAAEEFDKVIDNKYKQYETNNEPTKRQ